VGLGSDLRRPALAPGWIAVLVGGLVLFSVLVGTGHRRIANLVGLALLLGIVVAARSVRRR
jgi:hypothetical protein